MRETHTNQKAHRETARIIGHGVYPIIAAKDDRIRALEASLAEMGQRSDEHLRLWKLEGTRAEKAEAELAEARGLINDAALMAADHADSVLFDLLKAGGSSSHVKCGVAECPTCNPVANPPAPAKEG